MQSSLALMPERILQSLITQGQATNPAVGTVVWVGRQWIDFPDHILVRKIHSLPRLSLFHRWFQSFLMLYGMLYPSLVVGIHPTSGHDLFNLHCRFLLPFRPAALWGSSRTDGWGVRAGNSPFLGEVWHVSDKPIARCCQRASSETCAPGAQGRASHLSLWFCCPHQPAVLGSFHAVVVFVCWLLFLTLFSERLYSPSLRIHYVNVIYFGIH